MTSPVIATVRISRTAQSAKVLAIEDSGSAPDDDTSSLARPLVTTTTAPRAAVLISALAASHRPWPPNIRLSPVSGFIFFRLGLIALPVTTTPPWAADAAVPTAMSPSAVGSRAVRKALRAWPMSVEIAAGSGCVAMAPIWMNSICAELNDVLTSMGSSTLAAATPAQVPSSWVRGICPSLRAFLRRCGVGFSVFSPPGPSLAIASAALQRDDRPGRMLDQGVQRRGEQGEGLPEQRQGQHDLHRKAQLEDVERGSGPAEQGQRHVGEQQHSDHRAGDLQGREEHHPQRRHE